LALLLHLGFKCLLERLEDLQEVPTSPGMVQEDLDLVLAENQRIGLGETWLKVLLGLLVHLAVGTLALLVNHLFLKSLVSKLIK
jgi:hypothetical protein